jgi:proteasome accessory factor A
MTRLVFGVETEYGFSVLSARGEALDRASCAMRLVRVVRGRRLHLAGDRQSNVFLANGARFYIDCGAHPEYATPECSAPEETVASVRAGDRILEQAALELESEDRGIEAILYRGNTDYADPGVTWGMHESFQYHTPPRVMARNIIPHLVSRIVYSGAGGLDAAAGGIVFTLSPRARFVQRQQLATTGPERALFHCKDEPLGRPNMHRLHLVCGDSLCSEWAEYLRVGATALIVALIDAGHECGLPVHVEDPFGALHRFARDVDCTQRVPVSRGRMMSALQIQQHYLEQVKGQLGAGFLPVWAPEFCERWERALRQIETQPLELWRRYDWPLKLMLFRDHARRRGFTWARIEQINRQRGGPKQTDDPAETGASGQQFSLSLFLSSTARADRPKLAGAAELAAFDKLRRELFEIDTRFSQLGSKGIFSALDRAGVLDHQVVARRAIERAVEHPPSSTRARQRGRLVRSLHKKAGVSCGWTTVLDASRGRILEMFDPRGETRPSWRPIGKATVPYFMDVGAL